MGGSSDQPTPPPPPPAAPQRASVETGRVTRDRRDEELRRRGRASTVMTTGEDQARTGTKALLGG